MIFLTSDLSSVAHHLHSNFLQAHTYNSVLFIDTAAEVELDGSDSDAWFYADLQSLVDQGYTANRFTLTGKTLEEITTACNEHDIIYFSGGNCAHLLDQLQQTHSFTLFQELVRAGKPYIGTSAGSIVAGPHLPPYLYNEEPTLADYSCFGFVNVIPVPHWGSDHFKDLYLGGRLTTAYEIEPAPLLLLRDTQYLAVTDTGTYQVVDVLK